MKIIIYAIVQLLIRLAPREVQLLLIYAAVALLLSLALVMVLRALQRLYHKLQAHLALRRAYQQLLLLERRLAADAASAPTLDPYRQGSNLYQKELAQILAPLSQEQQRSLLESKRLTAALKAHLRTLQAG